MFGDLDRGVFGGEEGGLLDDEVVDVAYGHGGCNGSVAGFGVYVPCGDAERSVFWGVWGSGLGWGGGGVGVGLWMLGQVPVEGGSGGTDKGGGGGGGGGGQRTQWVSVGSMVADGRVGD